jgi:diaminohydroxyphosphoribosylaminopyrimidine deaminase/5-amino-6-(5-phosphoribosylamino)uracil reductase
MLRAAGISVETGVLERAATELNAGFLKRVTSGRPLTTLKLATTLDGRIATRTGESQWITGATTRQRGHLLRATHDAILVGSGTALADDPRLTCRLPGLTDRSPVRVVLDRRLRLPMDSNLARTAREVPTWLVTQQGHPAAQLQPYLDAGIEVIELTGQGDPAEVLSALGDRGITRLLIEGGAETAAAFLAADQVDRLAWMRAPGILGGDALAAIAALGLDRLSAMRRFELQSAQIVDGECLETYRRLS